VTTYLTSDTCGDYQNCIEGIGVFTVSLAKCKYAVLFPSEQWIGIIGVQKVDFQEPVSIVTTTNDETYREFAILPGQCVEVFKR
jgi:hypothetical protein